MNRIILREKAERPVFAQTDIPLGLSLLFPMHS